MKITILEKGPQEEDEIIIKCNHLDENISRLLNHLKNGCPKLTVYKESQIILLDPKDILYFESVEDKVFAYTKDMVYESRMKLYMIEDSGHEDFFRVSKSVIVNLKALESLTPLFAGRFEAKLKNGYKVIISRNYIGSLKKILGI